MAGITFTHLYQTANNLLSKRAQDSLHYLKHQVGTEWIALNPFAYQHTFDDPNIYLEGDPPDAHLRHAIREARRLELKVMLKPHIWLRDGSKRGAIEMAAEEDWEKWFSTYRTIYPALCQIGRRRRGRITLHRDGAELYRNSARSRLAPPHQPRTPTLPRTAGLRGQLVG